MNVPNEYLANEVNTDLEVIKLQTFSGHFIQLRIPMSPLELETCIQSHLYSLSEYVCFYENLYTAK